MRIVAKFGGTSIENGRRLKLAADSIANAVEDGHEVIAVASAMGDTTDQLLNNMEFETPEEDKDEILSMGERTSIRMLKAALNSNGVDADFVDPESEEWPVILDENGIDEERTREKAEELLSEMESEVPVIAGFVGVDKEGRVRTLERGGSDTTALMLGDYLDADKVVIVTDVEGILTGDPELVENPDNNREISVGELRNLSFRGADVVSPEALSFKSGELDVEVVHYQEGDLLESGTSIGGRFERVVNTVDRPLACLTVVGDGMKSQPGILTELSESLQGEDINVEAIGSGAASLSYFIDEEDGERGKKALHRVVADQEEIVSVTLDTGIAAVRMVLGELPDRPGLIHRLSSPIADTGINIYEVITSASSITVFVDWEDREKTLELMKNAV